ncbi:MAG: hypothetical protein LBK22_05225 [Tannerella sp.]|jgi:hypothetical protein|nr:hypothetical protein [Tannerella sp.]
MEKKETATQSSPVLNGDFIAVAKNIAKHWKEKPAYTLLWTDAQQFEQAIHILEILSDTGKAVQGERTFPAGNFKDINTLINRHLVYVKGYLMKAFSKKEAQVQYVHFGIARLDNGHFGLPADGEERLHALQQLVKALETSEFRDNRYGYKHWKNILKQFEDNENKVFIDTDAPLLHYVRQKKERKAMIRQTLNALILLIRANHPQHWRSELSNWGFRKEKY